MTATETKTAADRIRKLRPCKDALAWVTGYTDPQLAWKECERGDWMLWLVGKGTGKTYGGDMKRLVLAACDCAALSLKYTKDEHVTACIDTARRWANGLATQEELRDACAATLGICAYAAKAALAAASIGAHGDAVRGGYVAYTAYAAATYAAYGGAYVAYPPLCATASLKTLKKCADIVRMYYPNPPNVD